MGRAKNVVRQGLARVGFSVRRSHKVLLDHPEASLTPTIDMLLHFVECTSSPVTFALIGAFDGEQGDLMRPHVLKGAWRGAVVEPQLAAFKVLDKNYAEQVHVTAIHAAVGATPGRATLYKAADGGDGSLDWTHQQASLNPEQVRRLEGTLPQLRDGLFEEEVEVITFSEVMRRAQLDSVVVVQIDTEGMDWQILKTIDLAEVRPKLIIFEHRHLSWKDQGAALDHLVAHQYRVASVTPFDTAAVALELLEDA